LSASGAQQQGVQRGTLLVVERPQHVVLHGGQRAFGVLERGAPRWGELDNVAPAIVGVVLTHEELVSLEVVEQPDEVARVDA
jgi:hypothetical protein